MSLHYKGGRLNTTEVPVPVPSRAGPDVPRIILKDQGGFWIDTDTQLQRAIYAAKARIEAAVRGVGVMEEGDWRLGVHAPPPARPDYSRLTRTTPRRHPHRLTHLGGAKETNVAQSMPHLSEILPDEDRPNYQEISWFTHRHTLYPWLMQQSVSLDHVQTQPVCSAALLRQTTEALSPRIYLPLSAGEPPGKRYSLEVPRRRGNAESHRTVSGLARQGLCYGCDKSSGPHIHQDRPMRTGGGFKYFRHDRPHGEKRKNNPINWKVNIWGKPPKYAFLEVEDDAKPDFFITENLPSQPAASRPSSELNHQVEKNKSEPDDGQELEVELSPRPEPEDEPEPEAEPEPEPVPQPEPEPEPTPEPEPEPSITIVINTGDELEEGKGKPLNNKDEDKKPVHTSPLLPGRQRGKLYEAPKAFIVKPSDKKITQAGSPFSDNRNYNIPDGGGIDIKPSDKELTQFVKFDRPEDAPKLEPVRRKSNAKQTKVKIPRESEPAPSLLPEKPEKQYEPLPDPPVQKEEEKSPTPPIYPPEAPPLPVPNSSKPPKKEVIKTQEPKPHIKKDPEPEITKAKESGYDVLYIPEVKKVEVIRERTVLPPTPPSPPRRKAMVLPPLPSAAPYTPPVPPKYHTPRTPFVRDIIETPQEIPLPKLEPPPQNCPVPGNNTRKKRVDFPPLRREKRRPQVVMSTPAPRDPKPVTDPLDYLAKYCIIHQDRLPYYDRIFRKVISGQIYRYEDVPLNDASPIMPEEGATKTHLTQHERNMLQDMTLISRTTKPGITGQNASDQMVSKVNFTLEHMEDKYKQLHARLEDLKADRVEVLAGLAREYFPQITKTNYKAGKKMKKGKKEKKMPRDGNRVVFLKSEDGPQEQRNTPPREESPRPPTDTDIVNRLNQKMMATLKTEDRVCSINMEIERVQHKLRTVDDRIHNLEGERQLLQLQARDTFFERQGERAKSATFMRKQSPLYRKLNPAQDVEMNISEMEQALQQINGHLLTEKEMQYIYHILDLPGRQRVNLHTFAAIAALSEKVKQVEPFVKKLINKVDFEALSLKMERCKELFQLLREAESSVPEGTVSAEALSVDLAAGGLCHDNTSYVMGKFDREHRGLVDFLDFLTYIPLFIEVHERIVDDPLSKDRRF